jgi:hypothetical protein
VGIYLLPVVLYTFPRERVDAWTARRLPLPATARRRATAAASAAPARTRLPLAEGRR